MVISSERPISDRLGEEIDTTAESERQDSNLHETRVYSPPHRPLCYAPKCPLHTLTDMTQIDVGASQGGRKRGLNPRLDHHKIE